MELIQINWWAVIVASLVSFAIGAFWFGPKTFYPVWMRALGRTIPTERIEMKAGETALMFGGSYLAALVQVITLAVVFGFARALGLGFDWQAGALFGFFLSVGFGAFASLSHRMFGQANYKVYQSLRVWLIEVGQDVVSVTIAGAILAAWV